MHSWISYLFKMSMDALVDYSRAIILYVEILESIPRHEEGKATF